jgi:hypothetical protein
MEMCVCVLLLRLRMNVKIIAHSAPGNLQKKQPELEGKMFSFFAWISFSSMSLRAGGSLEKKNWWFH